MLDSTYILCVCMCIHYLGHKNKLCFTHPIRHINYSDFRTSIQQYYELEAHMQPLRGKVSIYAPNQALPTVSSQRGKH